MLLGWLPHMLNHCYSYLVCCYMQTTCGSCWVVSVLREGKHTSRYPSVLILLLFLFSLCPWWPLSSPHHPQFGDVSNLIRKEFVDAKSVLRDVTVGRILHCFSILWFQVFGTGQDHSRRRLQVQDGGLAPTRVLRAPQWAPYIFSLKVIVWLCYYRYVYRWGPRAEVCVDKRKLLALVAEVIPHTWHSGQ